MQSMLDLVLAAAPAKDTPTIRAAVCAVSVIFGVIFIIAGRNNIRTGVAEESGSRRSVNRILGRSNTYRGNKARAMGWMRIVCGIAAIIFGIVFTFTGPFLAK